MTDITNILEEIKSLGKYVFTERKKLEKDVNEIDKNIKRGTPEYSKILTGIYYTKFYDPNWDKILKFNNELIEVFPNISINQRIEIWDILQNNPSLQNCMFGVYDKNSNLDYLVQYKLNLLKVAIINFIDIDEYYGCLSDYVEEAKEHSFNYKPVFKEISQYADNRIHLYQELSGQDIFLIFAGEKPDPYDD